MKKVKTIENDCAYIKLDKPNRTNTELKLKEIVVGDIIIQKLKETGIVKLKKFLHKDTIKERNVAYKYEKNFKKENDSRWFVISEIELLKHKIPDCSEFYNMHIVDHNIIKKTNGVLPLKKKHYYYIVVF